MEGDGGAHAPDLAPEQLGPRVDLDACLAQGQRDVAAERQQVGHAARDPLEQRPTADQAQNAAKAARCRLPRVPFEPLPSACIGPCPCAREGADVRVGRVLGHARERLLGGGARREAQGRQPAGGLAGGRGGVRAARLESGPDLLPEGGRDAAL